MRRDLLIGCGARRDKRMVSPGESEHWDELVTLDINPDHKPDVVWDLNVRPLPFEDNSFDGIRAFDVLEHLGRQGDYRSFFEEWSEWWRLLKPDGILYGASPHWANVWSWADPGHTRAMSPEMFTFLSQDQYEKQVGETPMTDYRFLYRADFALIHSVVNQGNFEYGLRAIKPSRIRI